jgi:hypothetical protein
LDEKLSIAAGIFSPAAFSSGARLRSVTTSAWRY